MKYFIIWWIVVNFNPAGCPPVIEVDVTTGQMIEKLNPDCYASRVDTLSKYLEGNSKTEGDSLVTMFVEGLIVDSRVEGVQVFRIVPVYEYDKNATKDPVQPDDHSEAEPTPGYIKKKRKGAKEKP